MLEKQKAHHSIVKTSDTGLYSETHLNHFSTRSMHHSKMLFNVVKLFQTEHSATIHIHNLLRYNIFTELWVIILQKTQSHINLLEIENIYKGRYAENTSTTSLEILKYLILIAAYYQIQILLQMKSVSDLELGEITGRVRYNGIFVCDFCQK